jgi:hypothetical protein
MINATMRSYDYYLYGDQNAYGQQVLSDKACTIKMTISVSSQNVQDNILYGGAEYVGLTHAELSDKYVIQYGEAKLKVLYVNPQGRFKQVFLTRM